VIKRILVIGGTGMLGQPVAASLINSDFDVKILTHSPEKARAIFGDLVECREGDVTDRESLREPMKDCDTVYINLNAKMNPADYERIERKGAANVSAVASELGLKRIAMISGLTVSDKKVNIPFLTAKYNAEKELIESGVPYTIFRCCWFFETLPLFIVKKNATYFGKQPHKRSWIASVDYGQLVAKSFQTEEAENKIFHIRGIDKFTMGEALRRFCEIAYPDVKVSSAPLWLMTIVSKFSKNKSTRGLAQFLKYFNNTPDPDTEDDSEKILGPALTTLEDWAQNYKIRVMTQ
jgi:uncharacterized protein YbjT (DUF2867 family)